MRVFLSKISLSALWLIAISAVAQADEAPVSQAHYLGNAGVMLARGDAKVLFDPFFRNDYGVYDLVPADIEQAIFSGSPPYDGVDAVFVSHQHDDHFDPDLVVAYLAAWPEINLYAPQQAVDLLLTSVQAIDPAVLDRVHGLELSSDSAPVEIRADSFVIEATYLAHAGWPSRNTEVDNIAFRVTIDKATTVVHLGDADKASEHYEPQRDFWEAREPQLAFAPVWLLLTEQGQFVLDEYVDARQTIGVHVYDRVPEAPEDRPADFDGLDIFTRPGELRDVDQVPADLPVLKKRGERDSAATPLTH